jgi:general secretion pathway protein M
VRRYLTWVYGLQQKQLLIGAAAVVVLLVVGLGGVRPLLGARQRLELSIATGEHRLQELLELERDYRLLLAENAGLKEALGKRRRDFTLFGFLEGLASRDELRSQIEFMRPSVKVLNETFQEEQVEMRLNGVSMKRLIPYLYHIETAPEQIRVRRLTMRPQQRNPSLLEVNVVLVTRGLREKPQGAAG